MNTLADLKRAMVVGTAWHCYNHLFEKDMGTRRVSRVMSNKVAFETIRPDGSMVDSWFDFPKSKDIEFIGGHAATISYDGKLGLTYRLVHEETK